MYQGDPVSASVVGKHVPPFRHGAVSHRVKAARYDKNRITKRLAMNVVVRILLLPIEEYTDILCNQRQQRAHRSDRACP